MLTRGTDGTLFYNSDRPQSIGKIKAYTGHFGMHVRALCYILANGPEGLKETTEVAVLNANYIRYKLQGVYALPYNSPTLHEVVFSDRNQEQAWCQRLGYRKAAHRLRLPSADHFFSADRLRARS